MYIEVSRDVIFHEEVVFRQTQELSKEDEVPPLEFLDSKIQREDAEFEDQIPDALEDTRSPPEEILEVPPSKRRPAWYRETVQEVEKHKAPPGTLREGIRPQKYLGLMSQLISVEPSTYKEATSQQVWIDAMIEEYSSIMKNDVWEVVPRPTRNSMVTSRWLYKIKHAADGSLRSTKPDL